MARPVTNDEPHLIPNDPQLQRPPSPTSVILTDIPDTVSPDTDNEKSTSQTTQFPPPIRPVDKPRSSEPNVITITEDGLRRGIGF